MSGTISALLPSRFIRPPPSVALKSDRDELSCAMELMGTINISIKSKANFPPIVPNAFYKVFMASQVKTDAYSLETLVSICSSIFS